MFWHSLAYPSIGHVIISGCSGGMVAISNPSTGLVVHVMSDHQGAPVTDLHTTNKPVKVITERVNICN